MKTALRIREVSPAELLADRLDREASVLTSTQRNLADDYRRQARMLREMSSYSFPN